MRSRSRATSTNTPRRVRWRRSTLKSGSWRPTYASCLVIRLKHVLSEVDNRSLDGEGTLLAVSRHVGVVPRDEITDRESRSESLEGYKRVRVGQLAVNKMRAFNGA